jgi:hypothetical protein
VGALGLHPAGSGTADPAVLLALKGLPASSRWLARAGVYGQISRRRNPTELRNPSVEGSRMVPPLSLAHLGPRKAPRLMQHVIHQEKAVSSPCLLLRAVIQSDEAIHVPWLRLRLGSSYCRSRDALDRQSVY